MIRLADVHDCLRPSQLAELAVNEAQVEVLVAELADRIPQWRYRRDDLRAAVQRLRRELEAQARRRPQRPIRGRRGVARAMIDKADVAAALRRTERERLLDDERQAGAVAAALAARVPAWRRRRAELLEALRSYRRAELRRALAGRQESATR